MKKIVLVLIGILISFLIIEIFLISVSYFVSIKEENKYKDFIKSKEELVILCLGESTTDGQWPKFLPKELEKEITNKKFTVIDKGVKATNTSVILKNVPMYIEQYKPDIIISMMGINDGSSDIIKIKNYKLKTIKLMYLIKQHIVSKFIEEHENISLTEYDVKIQEAIQCYNENRYDEGIEILTKLYAFYPEKSVGITRLLARMYTNRAYLNGYNSKKGKQDIKKAEQIVLKEIEKDKYFDINLILFTLSKAQNKEKLEELFPVDNQELIKQLYSQDPWGFISHVQCMIDLKMYNLAKLIDDISYDNPNIKEDVIYRDRVIGSNATNLLQDKNFSKANKYYKLQKKNLLNNHLLITIENYNLLYDICEKNNIKLIAMQYPVRPVEALKVIFKDKNNVCFIDNEKIFKTALRNNSIEDIFVDLFAGDFGHCTDKGNIMIANNVSKTIKKICK